MRLAIAAGGTGGHIYPALALIETLNSGGASTETLVFGREEGMEKSILGEQTGVTYVGLRVRSFTIRKPLAALVAIFRIAGSVCRSIKELSRWKPDAVIGMGGYVAAPVVLAAVLARFPVAIADQNALPGRANRRLARWVKRVFMAYEESAKYFPREKSILTGIPLRRALHDSTEFAPFEEFGLSAGRFTILVFGGSQGARALCEATAAMITKLNDVNIPYQILLQAGKRNIDLCKEMNLPENVSCIDTIEDMAGAYACSDLVVCRAGAVSLAEIALVGKAAILVPYPYAKDDHQMHNARVWEKTGAARIIEQDNLNGNVLAEEIASLMNNRDALISMSQAAKRLSHPDATEHMLRELEMLADKKWRSA